MICITGIPGTGKSTICRRLNEAGIPCANVLDLPGSEKCRTGDEVDIDCLESIAKASSGRFSVLEGHYSHLLSCDKIFILQRNEDAVLEVLKARGYSAEKINENIDAQRCDVIFQEALDRNPANRLFRIVVSEEDPDLAFNEIIGHIVAAKTKIK